MERKLLSLFIMLMPVLGAFGQYDIHFTHFVEMENFYNPAAMNRDSRLNAVASFSMQMAGYTHAPVSLYAGASSRLPFDGGRHAAGISLFNESIGLFESQRMAIDYAYKIGVGKGWINIGLQGAVMSQTFNGQEAKMHDSGDPAFPSGNDKGTGADIGAGLFYVRQGLWLGLAGQHLNSPHIEFGKADAAQTYMDIDPAYFFQGGYNIKTSNPLLEIQPGMMLSSDLNSFRADVQTRVIYRYDRFDLYGGLTWSPGISWTVLLGGTYGNLTVGYAYELFTSGVGMINGSHDLLVNWKKDVDFFKRGRNSHKSVRYL